MWNAKRDCARQTKIELEINVNVIVGTLGEKKMQIERRVLGDTGLSVPIMGVGCAPFGFAYDSRGLQTQETVNETVAEAISLGCNLFDTSPYYGDSEKRLGVALEQCGVERSKGHFGYKVWTLWEG